MILQIAYYCLIFYLHFVILQSTQNSTSVSAHTDFEGESEMSFIRKFSKSQTPTHSTEVPEKNVRNEVTVSLGLCTKLTKRNLSNEYFHSFYLKLFVLTFFF